MAYDNDYRSKDKALTLKRQQARQQKQGLFVQTPHLAQPTNGYQAPERRGDFRKTG